MYYFELLVNNFKLGRDFVAMGRDFVAIAGELGSITILKLTILLCRIGIISPDLRDLFDLESPDLRDLFDLEFGIIIHI